MILWLLNCIILLGRSSNVGWDLGVIAERKGVNFPGASLEFDTWGGKDREALEFGLSLGIDFVAQSFVGDAADILKMRKIIDFARNSPYYKHYSKNR